MLANILGLITIILAVILFVFPLIEELYYTIKFKMEEESDYNDNPGMSARDAWRKHHGGID